MEPHCSKIPGASLLVQPNLEMKMEMSMLPLQMKHYMMITKHKLNPFCLFIKLYPQNGIDDRACCEHDVDGKP